MTSAREVFDRFADYVLGRGGDVWADDVVIEQPFSEPQRRIEGRANFIELTRESREALPFRFEEVRDVVVHETTDPDQVVVEYVLAGTVLTTGRHASAPFIVVMRVRDGKVVLWREYQNTLAMAESLGQDPSA